MSKDMTRRSVLKAFGALGAAASLDSVGSLFGAESMLMPKKVDKLSGEPVLTVAHCADPQFGFAGVDYGPHLERCERLIDVVNAAGPDVVFFAGDMCDDKNDLQKDWPRLLERIKPPVLVAPGNHDIYDPVVRKDVEAYCAIFGADYESLTINGWKIVVVNSQYCRDTDETELYEKQVEWFTKELTEAKASGTPVILGSHVPPFVNELDEEDDYFNFPSAIRRDYLEYARQHGCRFCLAGHTHTTLEREYEGVKLLNSETTSLNFDERPFGFRMLKIDAEMNYEWNFVGLD